MHGFFDPEGGGPLRLELVSVDGSRFRMLRSIGYHDACHAEPFVVPADLGAFGTDLTTVPWFMTWLVPRTGLYVPAAVLHDGLVGHWPVGEGASYLGPRIPRVEADRVFRRAMADTGTPPVRRWLVWTAVTLPTVWWTLRPRWAWRARAVLQFGGTAAIGVLATLDLLDVVDVLPWMGARPWWAELLLGALAAVVVPTALSVTWGRLWRAAAIGGVAIALLLHVTVAVLSVYGVYAVSERLFGWSPRPELRRLRHRG